MSPGWNLLREVLAAAAMLGGTFFMIVTGLGLLRFPDVYTRMHAAGKAGTIGVALLILAQLGPILFLAVPGGVLADRTQNHHIVAMSGMTAGGILIAIVAVSAGLAFLPIGRP